MGFEIEMATYHSYLPGLLEHPDKWVVIHKYRILGIWNHVEDAFKAGDKEFGAKGIRYMIKQIRPL